MSVIRSVSAVTDKMAVIQEPGQDHVTTELWSNGLSYKPKITGLAPIHASIEWRGLLLATCFESFLFSQELPLLCCSSIQPTRHTELFMRISVIRICWLSGGGGTVRSGTDGLHQMASARMPTARVSSQVPLKQDNQCCSLQPLWPSLLWLTPVLQYLQAATEQPGWTPLCSCKKGLDKNLPRVAS